MNHNTETRRIIHQHWNLSSGAKITGMIQKYWGIGKFKETGENLKKTDTQSDIIKVAEKLFN